MEKNSRGGKREGAGRTGRYSGVTTVIRIPKAMKTDVLAFVDILSDWLSEGKGIKQSSSKTCNSERKSAAKMMHLLSVWEMERQEKEKKQVEDKRQLSLF